MKPLVIIPARGGSKGVPGKNIKILGGKPLIHYTIEAAQEVVANELICVTTDDAEIKACAEKAGVMVPFIRPAELASDTSGTYEVLLHALSFYENKGYSPDIVILLQPTSPFRTSYHIKKAVELYNPAIDMVVSVKETRSNPYYVLFEENENGHLEKSKKGNFMRRQDCPHVYELNGAIYVMNCESLQKQHYIDFKRIVKYLMDDISSIDIDSMVDWKLAEFYRDSIN
jgi:CMP-N,N'-diacetyllegionaminic acid synthase